jgi:hypothetical protein
MKKISSNALSDLRICVNYKFWREARKNGERERKREGGKMRKKGREEKEKERNGGNVQCFRHATEICLGTVEKQIDQFFLKLRVSFNNFSKLIKLHFILVLCLLCLLSPFHHISLFVNDKIKIPSK